MKDTSTNFFELFDKVLTRLEEEKQVKLKKKLEEQNVLTEEKHRAFEEKAMETLAEVSEMVQSVKRRGRPKKLKD